MTTTDAPSVLAGRYLLGGRLGHGGMAVVYRGWDTLRQRDVAVKILRTLVADPAGRARFRAEGDVLARLHHPGLVTLYDTGEVDGSPYLVMELIEGQTLSAVLRRGGLAAERVLAAGIALARVLTYVHDRGITHRDVKPGNILLDDRGRVRLADFGVARVPGAAEHTQPGFTMGTAAYISPEQVRGEPATPASDVYSLGLVLLEAFTGRRVYPGPADSAALARLSGPPPVAAAPAALHGLLAAMTADSPADRPPAAAVRTRLEALRDAVPAGPGHGSADRPEWTTLLAGRPRLSEAWAPALVPEQRRRSRPPVRGVVGAAVAAALMLPVLTLVTCLLVAGGGAPTAAAPAPDPVRVVVQQTVRNGVHARYQPVSRIGAPAATRR